MTEHPVFEGRRLEDLEALTAFIERECAAADVPADAAFAVRLAVEEAFTNILQHGYGDRPGPVRCAIRIGDGAVRVTLADEAPLFDPAAAPAPDLESDWETRVEGGLGWHLVRRMMDEVLHQPAPGGGNLLTLIKRLPAGAP